MLMVKQPPPIWQGESFTNIYHGIFGRRYQEPIAFIERLSTSELAYGRTLRCEVFRKAMQHLETLLQFTLYNAH